MATNINTILNWFKTGLKPTQEQFWTTWASFWHKDEQIPQSSISGLENTLNTKAEKSQLEAHINNKKAHADLFDNKADIIHTHRIIDIQDLENTLNEKALIKHKHEITDIQNLESALDEKALLSHTHEITNIQNLESALDGKALITHTHEIVDIEDLEKTLNEKALLSHTHEITEIEGLKDQLNTKLTATLATDSETQIDTNISEDNKVISRLKLFNWWNWIKSLPLKWNNTITTFKGSVTNPPLIIPNGTLTTVPVNGAIERDENGILWETHEDIRSEISPTSSCRNLVGAFFEGNNTYNSDVVFHGYAQSGETLYMWKGYGYSGDILNGIYPSSFNSLTQMKNGDILETEIILASGEVGMAADYPYNLSINVYNNNDIKNTTVYSWNLVDVPYLTLKINLSKEKNSHKYLISVNGVIIDSLTNMEYTGKADCRLTITPNTTYTPEMPEQSEVSYFSEISTLNNLIYIRRVKATNLFIPASLT
ncbi:hypothetical protein LPB87_15015 [Flavobacterium sp. EDS]|uniref:hypothetical protein n=1 Tax=Flavobacterium sp. EDS TaxID=2897328 RepID=UPI001E28A132|nr:hypothetical protein [Flavobacterium sp. EDS]MCD0475707.1 hypothetical protein [Flavobacterium sp. EDS]